MSRYEYKKGREVDEYAKYMLNYPDFLATEIINHLHKINPGILGQDKPYFGLMVDAGCGSGLATKMFAPYFSSVTAFDISEGQIEKAKELNPMQNVKYVVGRGEDMPADDNSADLIVSAWAAEYMDTKQLSKECARVLKSNGCAALFGFAYTDLHHHSRGYSSEVISDLTGIDLVLALCEPFREYFLETEHGDVEAFTRFKGVYKNIEGLDKERNDELLYDVFLSLDMIKRYFLCIPSFYDFLELRRQNNEPDLLEDFGKRLKELWKVSHLADDDVHCKLTLSIFLIYLTKKKE